MKPSLLAISIGPVQDFIAAARKTRDLWFGSYVLSEISKSVAHSIADSIGKDQLIFPAPQSTADLEDGSPLAVANIILTRVPPDTRPDWLAQNAREAARARWNEFAGEAKRRIASNINEEVWAEQVDDVIEFYSAWVSLEEDDYPRSRKNVMRLLAGRKACRDFLPARGRAKVPKSSLDGARESVLKQNVIPSKQLPLTSGEQLDVIGVTKRMGGGAKPFPSVARVAADSWLRALSQQSGDKQAPLKLLSEACRNLHEQGLLTKEVSGVSGPYSYFPFNGECVYTSRHPNLLDEVGENRVSFTELSQLLAKNYERIGEPSPYLAVLIADGDQIGKVLAKLSSIAEHKRFSQALANFATEASRITEEYRGVCVYAGGDDVVALLPVDTSIPCSRALHDCFSRTLMESEVISTESVPTLSVGIAIGHFMEPLEDLL
ncbi:MAG: type III-B CRISPR-associated protein Cas10/Cmr2, partial [Cyanobacteria bacterium]|nr:type III-B CRISPR-associated protein Cas10/Cmr2 [Cyanobacteriota bacterium]